RAAVYETARALVGNDLFLYARGGGECRGAAAEKAGAQRSIDRPCGAGEKARGDSRRAARALEGVAAKTGRFAAVLRRSDRETKRRVRGEKTTLRRARDWAQRSGSERPAACRHAAIERSGRALDRRGRYRAGAHARSGGGTNCAAGSFAARPLRSGRVLPSLQRNRPLVACRYPQGRAI